MFEFYSRQEAKKKRQEPLDPFSNNPSKLIYPDLFSHDEKYLHNKHLENIVIPELFDYDIDLIRFLKGGKVSNKKLAKFWNRTVFYRCLDLYSSKNQRSILEEGVVIDFRGMKLKMTGIVWSQNKFNLPSLNARTFVEFQFYKGGLGIDILPDKYKVLANRVYNGSYFFHFTIYQVLVILYEQGKLDSFLSPDLASSSQE